MQLVDASNGRHLWAERFDRLYREFFALQDEVIAEVVAAVSVNLTPGELERIERPPTQSLEAYDGYLRAEQTGLLGNYGQLHETMAMYRNAIELDPEFSEAYAGLARIAVEGWRRDYSDLIQGGTARDIAYQNASKALKIDPANGRAYSVLSLLQLADGHHDIAIQSARRAVELSPGQAQSHLDLGLVLALAGHPTEGLETINTVLRLNPKPSADTLLYAGVVTFFNDNWVKAAEYLHLAPEHRGNTDIVWTYLAAAYGLLGDSESADYALGGLLKDYPNLSIEYFKALHAYIRPREQLQKLLGGLKSAGLPQWAFGHEGNAAYRIKHDELTQLTLGRTWFGNHLNGAEFIQQFSATGSMAYGSQHSLQTSGTMPLPGLHMDSIWALITIYQHSGNPKIGIRQIFQINNRE